MPRSCSHDGCNAPPMKGSNYCTNHQPPSSKSSETPNNFSKKAEFSGDESNIRTF